MGTNEKIIDINNKTLVDTEVAEEKVLNDDKLTDKEKIALIKTLRELSKEKDEEVLLG